MSHLGKLIAGTSPSREIDDWDILFTINRMFPWQNDIWDIPSTNHEMSPLRKIDGWDIPFTHDGMSPQKNE
jgi:hypothetical protein